MEYPVKRLKMDAFVGGICYDSVEVGELLGQIATMP